MKQVPELYDHQKDALEFISDKNVFALFMEQGTGKSKVVIEKASLLWEKNLIDAVIIISPNAVKEQWVTEQFSEHYPRHDWVGHIWEGMSTKREKEAFHRLMYESTPEYKDKLMVFSANVEAFHSDTIEQFMEMVITSRKVFLIIDESTRIKNGRRKSRRGKRGGAKRTNKILDQFVDVIHKCILTGTPTPRSPFDLWSQFEFLEENFFGLDFYLFRYRFGILMNKVVYGDRKATTVLDEKTFNIAKNKLNKMAKLNAVEMEYLEDETGIKIKDLMLIRTMEKYVPYKNLKILRESISRITFFRKKKDCLDLPDKVYEKLYCKLGKEQKRIYKSLQEEMYAEYMGEEITVINKAVMALRLQMVTGGIFPYSSSDITINADGEEEFSVTYKYSWLAESSKLAVLIEDLEEVSDETSIIIWANFRGEIDMIHKSLLDKGYSCEKYYGGSDPSVITRFKAKETRILIANPLKGGEGLNLQVSTLHYFYSNSFKADSRLQAEDRSHRIGQTNKVTYKDIICKGTIDERIFNVLKRKESLIEYFRGAELKEVVG